MSIMHTYSFRHRLIHRFLPVSFLIFLVVIKEYWEHGWFHQKYAWNFSVFLSIDFQHMLSGGPLFVLLNILNLNWNETQLMKFNKDPLISRTLGNLSLVSQARLIIYLSTMQSFSCLRHEVLSPICRPKHRDLEQIIPLNLCVIKHLAMGSEHI